MPKGRNPWVKKAFLALSHKPKSPISKQRDEDNATLILSLHMQGRVQSFVAVHFYPYMRQRGVFVSQFVFLHGVCRYQMYDERDKSLRFSCIYNQAHY